MINKKIGLLIGDENDWPSAFEGLARRLSPIIKYKGDTFKIGVERVRIHPFRLDAPTSYSLIIDRLAYWHYQPREWLKKVAMLNRVYMLNNPFTFQSMEKHTAYCAMLKLGLNIPETWLIPPKVGPQSYATKFEATAASYHDLFDLKEIAAEIKYPLFMKPFDGGGWRGVSQIKNQDDLVRAYNESGQTLMHLQAGLDDYEVFVRSLAIGPQVISLKYDPSQPIHGRYVIDHNFLDKDKGHEAQIITKVINAFFRWDFNSCEAILKDGVLWPIDFANACPDIAVTSLHYYFPWAIKALYAWSVYCMVTNRPMHVTMDIKPYFDIAESDRSYAEKLQAYGKLADAHLETKAFYEFKETHLKDLDETMWQYARSHDFDHIVVSTVQGMFPEHEHDKYIAHFRGLLQHWIESEAH